MKLHFENRFIELLQIVIISFFSLFNQLSSTEYSHCGRIIIDGYFDDWISATSIPDSFNDANGQIDLLEMKLSQDDDYIFIYLKFNSEFNIQENNSISLYLDCDNSSQTGEYFNGIGADLIWRFGDKTGTLYFKNNIYTINHSNIEICSLPSVTSDVFELAIFKRCMFQSQNIFPNNKIKIALSTGIGGDYFPDQSAGDVTLLFTQCDQVPLIPIEVDKVDENYLRVSCWNCSQDNLSNSSLTNIFQRIIRVYNPDIQGFEELYKTDETFLQNFFESTFPSEKWFIKKQSNTDIVLCSRYKILQSKQLNGNAAFLIEMTEKYNKNALVIVAHLPASQENTQRTAEIENIINFINSTKNQQSEIYLEKNSPIFIIGDMNLVGYAEQLKLLLTGNKNGYPQTIDWDSTAFSEANPRITEAPFCYTWTKDYSNYGPGKLDYIIFSDYSASLKKSFSINTAKMSDYNILKYGLNKDDSPKAADHLPIVADFEINNINNINSKIDIENIFFNSSDNNLTNNSEDNFNFSIYNILGNKIGNGFLPSFSSKILPIYKNGIYFILLSSIDYNSKPIIIRVCNFGFPISTVPILNIVPKANQKLSLP